MKFRLATCRPATCNAFILALWGFAVGVWLWASGLDVALQGWLYTHYNQYFNSFTRLLGQLSLGRTQVWGLVLVGAWPVLKHGGLHGLGHAARITLSQWAQWLRGRTGWLAAWAGVPTLTRITFTALGVVACSSVAQILTKCLIGRPRPKEWLWNGTNPYLPHPLGADSAFWSLPSGHTTSTFALFMWLALAYPRARVPLLAVATVFATSRFLAVTPHHLGDVIAGAALGAAVALWAWPTPQKGTSA